MSEKVIEECFIKVAKMVLDEPYFVISWSNKSGDWVKANIGSFKTFKDANAFVAKREGKGLRESDVIHIAPPSGHKED